jgi:hypothetical protein
MATRIIPERIILESDEDGWVEFHDPRDLTGEDHQRAMSHVIGDPDEPNAPRVSMAMEVVYGLAEALISAWHIPYAPKGTNYPAGEVPTPEAAPGVLRKLRMPDYAVILAAVAPVARLLNTRPSVDQAGVPGSPTVPSGG